jgi:hypothetical protein
MLFHNSLNIHNLRMRSESSQRKSKEPKTLKGIWIKKGFEKIVDLERELRKTRLEIQNQLP